MIKITEKQEQALKNMLNFLGQDAEEAMFEFETYEEFQTYFEELSKKCKRKNIIRNKIQEKKDKWIKIEKKEIIWDEKKLEFYCNKLFLKYGFGFFSRKNIKQKLLQRLKDEEIINKLLDKFEEEGKIDEELLKNNKINSKLKRGYGSNYIKQTLFKSWVKDIKIEIDKDVELENVKKIWDSIKDKYNLKDYKEKQKFIGKLVNKGFPFDIIKSYLKSLE